MSGGVYLKRLYKAAEAGLITKGRFAHAKVYHDNWCGSYKGKPCNCDPNITIQTSQGLVELLSDGRLLKLGMH